jgi:predicted  nucleic acid-binding Zn-ribbon protein
VGKVAKSTTTSETTESGTEAASATPTKTAAAKKAPAKTAAVKTAAAKKPPAKKAPAKAAAAAKKPVPTAVRVQKAGEPAAMPTLGTPTASGMNIAEVFDRLRSLQEVMFRRFELEREIENLPIALTAKGDTLNRFKQSYVDKNERYDNVKVNIDELRNQAIGAEREREQYEGQMDQIKTQREYEALDKEIRNAGEREVEYRRELQRQEEQLETLHSTLQTDEEHIGEQEAEVTEDRKRINGEVSDREIALKDLVSDESRITPGLDGELLFKFERIIRMKEGLGIVPLRGGVCTGCQIIMPPFFANRVRAGDELMFCPNCSRIVFYQPDDIEDEAFDSDEISFDDDELMFEDEPEEAPSIAESESTME